MHNNLNIETQIRSLTKLLEDIRKGNLQVPPFQRDFVWDRDAIKDLFDSIRNNYPIGSILLWKPKTKQPWQTLKNVGSFELPIENDQNFYLLDGYQRLSSLFGCLTNPKKSSLKYDQSLHSQYFNLYFDLKEETFIYLHHNKQFHHQVPVYILMSTSDFRQYSRKNIEPFFSSEELDTYLDRADAFSRSLIDYKLAVIEISEADLSDAVNIFSRINSKGTDISFDYMVSALSYKEGFNFGFEIDKLKEDLTMYNFDSISRNNLFRCYQSAFDEKLYIDQTDIEALATRYDFSSTVLKTTPCIKKAVEFLYNEMNVIDYKLLPYNIQLIFIMMFFKVISNPRKEQINDLKKWFWITTYSNYFTIYSLSNQRQAFAKFLSYLKGESNDIVFYDDRNIQFKAMPINKTISLSAVRSKALILFELRHYNKYVRGGNLQYHLTLHKICHQEKNSFGNIIPSNSIKDSNVITRDNKLWLRHYDKVFADKYFLPTDSGNLKDIDLFISERESIIVEAESKFVEKLNIKYTYPQ